MKLIVLICVVALSGVLAAPQGDRDEVTVVRSIDERDENGGYKFTFELSDGTIRSEAGAVKESVNEQGEVVKFIIVQGSYSFIAPDGQTHWVNYTADENGYHPTVGTGIGIGFPEGGIKPGQDQGIDPNLLKSLAGK